MGRTVPVGDGERSKRFGQSLARFRQRCGLSQAALAEEIGSKQSTVSAWERGESEPPPDAVFEIEKAFDLKPGTLSAILGYSPLDAEPLPNVEAAINADPQLDDTRRDLLIQIYRTMLNRRP